MSSCSQMVWSVSVTASLLVVRIVFPDVPMFTFHTSTLAVQLPVDPVFYWAIVRDMTGLVSLSLSWPHSGDWNITGTFQWALSVIKLIELIEQLCNPIRLISLCIHLCSCSKRRSTSSQEWSNPLGNEKRYTHGKESGRMKSASRCKILHWSNALVEPSRVPNLGVKGQFRWGSPKETATIEHKRAIDCQESYPQFGGRRFKILTMNRKM